MFVHMAHYLLLIISVAGVGTLAVFKPRRVEHVLFSILAASLTLLAVGQLLPHSLAVEQQFLALGTFATCNVFWLLTRAMFRKGKAIQFAHYVLAGVIALLILLSRSIDILVSLQWIDQATVSWLKRSLSEMLRLLSSGVILLAFWEAIRGYGTASKNVKTQKLLIDGTLLSAVLATRVIAPSLPVSAEESKLLFQLIRSVAASAMLIATFVVLWMHQVERRSAATTSDSVNEDDTLLASLERVMKDRQLYLNAELKMMDLAAALCEPEYKITRVLREKTDFDNVNHFINYFRLEHAKKLLLAPDSQHWTILVISMESGFASLATFNRTFKTQQGCTPNQYRKKYLADSDALI